MPTLSLSFLGPPRIALDSHPVELSLHKAIALLAYLAITGQSHSRKHLADLLWPESDAEHARGALRADLAALRRTLGDVWITAEGDTLSLRPSDASRAATDHGLMVTRGGAAAYTVDLDVALFRANLAIARAHRHTANAGCLECRARLTASANLYRGDFLTGFTLRDAPDFDLWQVCETEALRLELAEALERLVGNETAGGNLERALDYARRWLALDPLCEPAHRCLMRLYTAADDRRAALQQYAACREILAKELGISPEPETVALCEQIKTGTVGQSGLSDAASTTNVRRLPSRQITMPTGPFFGREQELAHISQALANPVCRMLTILGPGGAGKTTLAHYAASANVDRFRDGVCFVPLAPIRTVDLAPAAILQALDLPSGASSEPQHRLCHHVRDRQLLLVLDGFEHLLTGSREEPTGLGWLSALLASAPDLKLLITSRERLALHDEWLLPLGGLSLPPPDPPGLHQAAGYAGHEASPLDLNAYAASQLFLHCAQRGGAVLQPDAELACLMIHICRLVDGLPLAIELTAAWARILPLDEIAARLQTGLDLLTTSERDTPQRHHSMRAVFEHSWSLLSTREQSILRQLTVFGGSFTAEAAQAVAQATLLELAGLVDNSWLHAEPSGRYSLLELARQYCGEKLAADPITVSGESPDEIRDRYNAYYISVLSRQPLTLSTWQDQHEFLLGDLDNLRAIWPHAIAQRDLPTMRRLLALLSAPDVSPQLSIPLLEPAIQELTALSASADSTAFREEASLFLARLLCSLGRIHTRQGHLTHAADRVQAGLHLLAGLSRLEGWVEADYLLRREWALVAINQGDYLAALQEAQALSAVLPDIHSQLWPYTPERALPFWRAELAGTQFFALHRLGRYEEARQVGGFCLEQLAQIPWASNSLASANLGQLHCLWGKYDEGLRLAKDSLRDNQAHQQKAMSALSLLIMAEAEAGLNRITEAHEHLRQAIALSRAYEHPAYLTRSTVALARLELRLGRPDRARELCEDARAIFQQLGLEWEHIAAKISVGLGWAMLALLDAAAEAHFVHALRYRARQADDTMDALAGLAQASAAKGDAIRAVELSAFVAAHPAAAHAVKAQMSTMLAQLARGLAPESFADAIERGRASELPSVIATLVGGSSEQPR